MRIWERLIQAVGAVTVVLSLWGFRWLVDGLRRELGRPLDIPGAPFFRQALFAMNAIDATFLIMMIFTGTSLLLLRPSATRVYTWLYATLVIYAFAPGTLWTNGPVGRSIAAASGVGDLGLAPLLFYPFPFVFATLSVGLVNLAMRQLRTSTDGSGSSRVAVEPR